MKIIYIYFFCFLFGGCNLMYQNKHIPAPNVIQWQEFKYNYNGSQFQFKVPRSDKGYDYFHPRLDDNTKVIKDMDGFNIAKNQRTLLYDGGYFYTSYVPANFMVGIRIYDFIQDPNADGPSWSHVRSLEDILAITEKYENIASRKLIGKNCFKLEYEIYKYIVGFDEDRKITSYYFFIKPGVFLKISIEYGHLVIHDKIYFPYCEDIEKKIAESVIIK